MMPELPVSERVRCDVGADGVAHVAMTRGDKFNALDPAMLDGLVAAGEALAGLRGLRAVVLSGDGKAFCAGLDLASMGALSSQTSVVARSHGNANLFQQVALVWHKLPVPVVAAIQGICFGGGLQIATGADIRVVHPQTRLSIMEMKWGIIPDMGGMALWRGLVRDDVLRELTYTNREFSGEEAVRLGFATMADEEPLVRAQAIAREIATRNPDAIRAAKVLFNSHREMTFDAVLLEESAVQQKLIGSPNQIEAVASQMQKRPGQFTDA